MMNSTRQLIWIDIDCYWYLVVVVVVVVVVVNFTENHDNNLKTDDTTHTQ